MFVCVCVWGVVGFMSMWSKKVFFLPLELYMPAFLYHSRLHIFDLFLFFLSLPFLFFRLDGEPWGDVLPRLAVVAAEAASSLADRGEVSRESEAFCSVVKDWTLEPEDRLWSETEPFISLERRQEIRALKFGGLSNWIGSTQL